ncbi:outer membrane protein assembly factor BamC [Edwardsiella ictaluri]|uniref:outer membrane protein assembly factor BamC n=1 Tax=Edwardsiella ictaluri TaxID=67780 RepID=UPI0009BEE764|nr:outer membrane protein assembly factor BamC [Edwardsiella ictaluri]ARD40734.1 outer membrane protein assembly factor BamC [Edwardsiella ictaluri]QPW26283.1 outer membrane protein assembly factor BamC [Edwardsiella ictaluri]
MAYSVQKSTIATLVGVSLAMMLSACSSDQRYKRQVSGDEAYLETPALQELKVPAGMILPLQNSTYDIQMSSDKGAVGKALDIRPPAQAQALLNGSRTQYTNGAAIMLVENSAGMSGLWQQVVRSVQEDNLPIASRQDASQSLTTEWIAFNRADEDQQYRGRYQISVQPQGYQTAIVVKSLALEQSGSPVTSGSEIQRYAVNVLNGIVGNLDKIQSDQANARADRSLGQIDVQSGADDTGLPLLIVRAPYAQVWERLPSVLPRVGMVISDSSRSQGTVSVSYKEPSSSIWESLGASAPDLANGDYKIQVGDLDNRTSLQFLDSKGQPLTQARNDALVKVFQAAFARP